MAATPTTTTTTTTTTITTSSVRSEEENRTKAATIGATAGAIVGSLTYVMVKDQLSKSNKSTSEAVIDGVGEVMTTLGKWIILIKAIVSAGAAQANTLPA